MRRYCAGKKWPPVDRFNLNVSDHSLEIQWRSGGCWSRPYSGWHPVREEEGEHWIGFAEFWDLFFTGVVSNVKYFRTIE